MMRPNGRTLYKALTQRTIGWRRRVFLKVRIPASALPVPAPPNSYCKDWGEETCRGVWTKKLDGGGVEYHHICEISSSADPDLEDSDGMSARHFKTVDDRRLYRWWEGRHGVRSSESEPLKISNLPVEVIEAHRTWTIWEDMYLLGTRVAVRGPVIDAFLVAADNAKAYDARPSEDGRFVFFTYALSWPGKNRALQFVSDIKRAFRLADKEGVDVRLLRLRKKEEKKVY